MIEETNISKTTFEIVKESLPKGISYEEYRSKVSALVALKQSTGIFQTDNLINYTLLNDKRMKRLDKTLKISEEDTIEIKKIDRKVTWLVLTESWCGDAAQTMPIMNKIAKLNSNIDFKVLQRDENLELMNRFLYNNSLSIPKLIMVDDITGEVINDWGPRPTVATKMVNDFKEEHGSLTPEFKQDLQMWYTKDKGQNTIKDLLASLLLK
ncbi:thioredoxin family protein [Cellulophaga sp. HaHaR_3_176]|uniref:thioredoxin family protein n=1 Tax=Cellulophaga sp. HaHaR_3_176 TaxID=1942464 RepID=UPI001C1FD4D4|nr:thioredoxin family protein [Cellulophaga sp. HaHaR_3_176]QWX83256.1 thioredoxin family protein [Cellulophaga sp. HaHaR_3_176]